MTQDAPAARIPPRVLERSMVMVLLIVTSPYPAGSISLISPPAAVLLIAPARVLHVAVRLHGLASSPVPETHVRDACAWIATPEIPKNASNNAAMNNDLGVLIFST